MDARTIPSSHSSFPQTPGKMSKQKKKTKSKALTFENERPVRIPDIVKRPCVTTKFEKYTTRGVGENTDWFGVVGMPIFLSCLGVEFLPICIWRCGKMIIKVRVL